MGPGDTPCPGGISTGTGPTRSKIHRFRGNRDQFMLMQVPGRMSSIGRSGIWPGIRAPAGAILRSSRGEAFMDACQRGSAPYSSLLGREKRGFCPFFNSWIYNLFFGKPGFPGDSDQSGPARPRGMGVRGGFPLPDAQSGSSMGSKGNKGVYFPSILYQCI